MDEFEVDFVAYLKMSLDPKLSYSEARKLAIKEIREERATCKRVPIAYVYSATENSISIEQSAIDFASVENR